MAVQGMDTDGAQQIVSALNSFHEQISTAFQQISSQLEGLQWMGPDHDNFISNWNGQNRSQFNAFVNAIQESGQTLARNAQQQVQTSTSN